MAVARGEGNVVDGRVTVMMDRVGVGEAGRVIVTGSGVSVIVGAEEVVAPGEMLGRVASGIAEPKVQPVASTKTTITE